MLSQRTVTLAAAETSRGIRVYTKDAEGATRELCNDTAIEPLADGKTKDYGGEGPPADTILCLTNCSLKISSARVRVGLRANSRSLPALTVLCARSLCVLDNFLMRLWLTPAQWASWSQSVIYQDAKDDLREHRHLNKWEATNFVQSGALHGTSVAVVHSDGAKKVVLFYQDKEGFICYR